MSEMAFTNECRKVQWNEDRADSRIRRVGIFVDIPNIETSSISMNMRPDMAAIRREAGKYGNVIIARAYGIVHMNNQISNCALRSLRSGFEFVPVVLHGESMKDVDTLMTTDIVANAYEKCVDVFVIASGDSDFLPALNTVRKSGKTCIVVGVAGHISRNLADSADIVMTIVESNRTPNSTVVTASEDRHTHQFTHEFEFEIIENSSKTESVSYNELQ